MKIKIDGMACNHCVQSVKDTLSKIEGVKSVSVSLECGYAEIDTDIKDTKIL